MADADSTIVEDQGQEPNLAEQLRAVRAQSSKGQAPPETTQDQGSDSSGAETASENSEWGGDFDAERAKKTITAIREELRQERAQARQRELDLERSKMTENERMKSELEQLKQERDEAVIQSLVNEVAVAKKLPASALKFLSGKNRKELEASADELLGLIGTKAPASSDYGNGARPPVGDDGADFSSIIRRAAGRPA